MAKAPARAKGTAVAKRQEEVAGLPSMPDFMKQFAGEGTENIGAGDVEIPRIKLLQAISDELRDYDGLKAGEFFHTIGEATLGSELEIVPVYIDQRYILWRPRKDGGGILARADDGHTWDRTGEWTVKLDKGPKVTWKIEDTDVHASGLADWGSSNPDDQDSPPAATKMYNIVCALPAFPDMSPAVMSLQRSSIKVARRFLGKLRISRTPIYGMRFKVSAVDDKNTTGDNYLNYRFQGVGHVQDEQAFHQYREMHLGFKQTGVSIRDIEGLQGDDIPAGDDDDDEADDKPKRGGKAAGGRRKPAF